MSGQSRLRAVLVLAGGGSVRLGRDKTAADVGGRPVLDRLLDALVRSVPGVPIVVVGPPRPTSRPVIWCREDPPGGGPVAAIACGLAHLPGGPAADEDTDLVGVLAGDLPFAGSTVATLVAALRRDESLDGVLGADDDGEDQLLIGVHRSGPLHQAVWAQAVDGVPGGAVRRVIGRMRVGRVRLPGPATLDVDTAEDLARAQALAADPATSASGVDSP